MSDGERTFLYCLVVIITFFIIAVTSCNIHQDARVAEMVKNGANPIIASCSMGRGTEMACLQALEEIDDDRRTP